MLVRWIIVIGIFFGFSASGSIEMPVPVRTVQHVGTFPPPYGRTTVTAEVTDQEPRLRVMKQLAFVSETHRVSVSPDLLANFPLPQIEAMRLTWSGGHNGSTIYAAINVPFGDYHHKAQSYSRVAFVIVDGELEFYTVSRPRDEGGPETSLVRVKK